MTLIARNTAEGGTSGTAVATGGTGSGNAWDAVVNTSGVITYDNTHVDFGSLAYKVAMLTAVCRVSWTSTTLGAGTLTEAYVANDVYFTGSPTSSCHFMEGVTNAAAQAWAVDIASTGKLFIRNGANTNIYTSTNSIPVNSWARVEVHVVHNGAAGTIQVRLYASYTDASPLEDSGVLTNNFGADTSRLDFGALTSSTALPSYWFGEPRIGDAAGGWLGPASTSYAGSGAMTSGSSLTGSVTASLATTGGMTSGSSLAGQPGSTGSASLTSASTLAGSSVTAALVTAGGMTSGTSLNGVATATRVTSGGMTSGSTFSGAVQTPIAAALAATGPLWIAHRDATYATYGEETLEGYTAAAAQYSKALLEISIWDTSDGVYVCSHDQTTGRVFTGSNLTITSTAWTTLSPGGASTASRPATLVGGNPMRRLEEILEAFPTRLFVIENKHGTNQAALSALLDAHAPGRWMFKGPYNDTANAVTAAGHGAPMWLYFYPSQLGSLSTTYSAVSSSGVPIVFGLGDYSAAPVPVQSDATTFFTFTTANGIKTWAHILGTSTQKTTADGQASTAGASFNGYMTSSFPAIAPNDSSSAAMTSASALSGAVGAALVTAGGMTSGSTLIGSTTVTGVAAGGMASGSTLAGAPIAALQQSAGLTSGSALTGAVQKSTAGSSGMTSGSTLTGQPAAVAQAAGTMTSGSTLAGSAAALVTGTAGIVSASVLSGAVSATDTAAADMASASALIGAGTTGAAASMQSTSSLAGTAMAGLVAAASMASGSNLAGSATRATPSTGGMMNGTALTGSTASTGSGSAGMTSLSSFATVTAAQLSALASMQSASLLTGSATIATASADLVYSVFTGRDRWHVTTGSSRWTVTTGASD